LRQDDAFHPCPSYSLQKPTRSMKPQGSSTAC
jgi:hypothetical protein